MPTPYIGFGGDTLNNQPKMAPGTPFRCPHEGCDEIHIAEGPDDGGDLALFFKCGGKSYLCGVAGRSVIGLQADCSGEVDLS